MIIKYIGFLFTLLWSFTFIKTQSLFKKGSGFLITLFVSNISWLTFIAACFYGFKNFEFYYVVIGIVFIITLIQLTFGRISLFINSKFENKQLTSELVTKFVFSDGLKLNNNYKNNNLKLFLNTKKNKKIEI